MTSSAPRSLALDAKLVRALAIRVRLPGMSRAKLLASDGTLTNRRVYAAQIWDRDRAEQIAQQIRDEHKGSTVKVSAL